MIAALQQDFIVRAFLAGLALAAIAAPLGCFVVWRRMAYFGETIAQAGIIGVALGLLLSINLTTSVLVAALAAASLLIALARQSIVPFDSLLGLVAHAALALGVILASQVKGPGIDLMSFLFGDIFAVSLTDLAWIYGGGAVVAGMTLWLWRPLLAVAVHEELAAAEGVDTPKTKAIFIVMLALTIAIAMKIVGALLTIAFLIMPAAAARPFARTPERMAGMAALIGMAGVGSGIVLSLALDSPGGPSIVVMLSVAFALTLGIALLRKARARSAN